MTSQEDSTRRTVVRTISSSAIKYQRFCPRLSSSIKRKKNVLTNTIYDYHASTSSFQCFMRLQLNLHLLASTDPIWLLHLSWWAFYWSLWNFIAACLLTDDLAAVSFILFFFLIWTLLKSIENIFRIIILKFNVKGDLIQK